MEQAWLAIWAAAPQGVEGAGVPAELARGDVTLRQTVRVSRRGEHLRVIFSNQFGSGPARIQRAHLALARAAGDSTILPESDRALTFGGADYVVVPPGVAVASDAMEFPLGPLADVAITIHLAEVPARVTGHPGSRTTSFLVPGDAVAATALAEPARVDQWFFIGRIDVLAESSAGAVVMVGDSLTDGRGSTTNGNDRWPDRLAGRLQADARTAALAVLNQGIGGNRLLREGLGPAGIERLDRDVLELPGARWVIVFEGINDIGTSAAARLRGEPATSAEDLIAGYERIVARARARGLKVFAGTLTPGGGSFYDVPGFETDRAAVNNWIRTAGVFDAVIDFDAAVRDPAVPAKLRAEYDTGDHLHLNPSGYVALADAVPLELFLE